MPQKTAVLMRFRVSMHSTSTDGLPRHPDICYTFSSEEDDIQLNPKNGTAELIREVREIIMLIVIKN